MDADCKGNAQEAVRKSSPWSFLKPGNGILKADRTLYAVNSLNR